MMDEYILEDWKQLDLDMKAVVGQHDVYKVALDALSRLVKAASKHGSQHFCPQVCILHLGRISKEEKVCSMELVCKVLVGLPKGLREKVVRLSIQKRGQLFTAVESAIPVFDTIKHFLLAEAQLWQTLTAMEVTSKDEERVKPPAADPLMSDVPIARIQPRRHSTMSATPPVNPDAIAELSK